MTEEFNFAEWKPNIQQDPFEERKQSLQQRLLEEEYRAENFAPKTPVYDAPSFVTPKKYLEMNHMIEQDRKRDRVRFGRERYENYGLEGMSEQEIEDMAMFHVNPETGNMAYGLLSANEAMWQHTGMTHMSGLTSRNARNLWMRSGLLMAEDFRSRLAEEVPAFTEELERDRVDLEEFRAHKYNITQSVDPTETLTNHIFGESVEDAFYSRETLIKPRDGMEPSEIMMRAMMSQTPEIYDQLVQTGFAFEDIAEVNNTHEFTGRIMDHLGTVTIMNSLALAEKRGGTWGATAWSFLRDSIIDDPDSVNELALGAALSVTGVAPALILANKGRKGLKWFGKMKSLSATANATMFAIQKARKATKFLPSQLPHTALSRVLPEVADLPFLTLRRQIVEAPLNAFEGMLSGGGVALVDQYMMDKHYDTGYNMGNVWGEAWREALISPVLNPAMGSVFGLVGSGAAKLTRGLGNVTLGVGSDVRAAVNLGIEANRAQDMDEFDAIVKSFDQQNEIKDWLSGQLGRKITREDLQNDSALGMIARELIKEAQISEELGGDANILETLKAYDQARQGVLGDKASEAVLEEDLYAGLKRLLYQQKRSRLGSDSVPSEEKFEAELAAEWNVVRINRIAREVKEAGSEQEVMSPEDYREWKKNGSKKEDFQAWALDPDHPERLKILIPDEMRKKVEARVGEDASYEDTIQAQHELVIDEFAEQENDEQAILVLEEEVTQDVDDIVADNLDELEELVSEEIGDDTELVIILDEDGASDRALDFGAEEDMGSEQSALDVIAEASAEEGEATDILPEIDRRVKELEASEEPRTEEETLELVKDTDTPDEDGNPTVINEELNAKVEELKERGRNKRKPKKKTRKTAAEVLEMLKKKAKETGDTALEERTKNVDESLQQLRQRRQQQMELARRRKDIAQQVEALIEEQNALDKELLETNDDYKTMTEAEAKAAEIQRDIETQSHALTLALGLKRKAKTKKDKKDAAKEAKRIRVEQNKLINRKNKLVSEARSAKVRLKKNKKMKKLRDISRNIEMLKSEYDTLAMESIVKVTEGMSKAQRYRAYGSIMEQMKALNLDRQTKSKKVEFLFQGKSSEDTIDRRDVVQLLYDGEEGGGERLNLLDSRNKGKDNFTETEVRALLKRWSKQRTKDIVKLKYISNTTHRSDMTNEEFLDVYGGATRDVNDGQSIDEIDPDNHLPPLAMTPESAVERNSKRVGYVPSKHKTTRENESNLLAEAFRNVASAQMTLFGSAAYLNADSKKGTASEDIVLACLPKALRDIGIHVLFEEAIVNKSEMLHNLVTDENKHLARYDLTVIADILFAMRGEVTKADRNTADWILDSRQNEMKDPNDPLSYYELHGVMEELDAEIAATNFINQRLAARYGFRKSLDRHTETVSGEEITAQEYVDAAENAAITRLGQLLHPRVFERLSEQFITPEEALEITRLHPDDPAAQNKASLKIIVETFIEENDLKLVDFGNGKSTWQPATELGKGIAHVILGDRDGSTYGLAVDPATEKGIDSINKASEVEIHDSSVKPVHLVSGELNHASPHKASTLRALKEDWKIRKRIEHIIREDMTHEEAVKFLEWCQDKNKAPLPDEGVLGRTPLGVTLLPDINNKTPHTSPDDIMARKEKVIEALLDMPHALYSFIHDSQTLMTGQNLFFADQSELMKRHVEEFTDEAGNAKTEISQLTDAEKQTILDRYPELKLYHADPAKTGGTQTAAVSLAGVAYVMGWERTYKALEGISREALDAGIDYLERTGGTLTKEQIYSAETYFDKSFNGKHHFHAMLLDVSDPNIEAELNALGDELLGTGEDLYVKAARLTNDLMTKAIDSGNFTTEETQTLIKIQKKFYDVEWSRDDTDIAGEYKDERAFWKKPIMVRLYSAGQPAIRRAVLDHIGGDPDFTEADAEFFAKFLGQRALLERNGIIDAALGSDAVIDAGLEMKDSLRNKVASILEKPLGQHSRDALQQMKQDMGLTPEQELDPNTTLRRRLDQRIEKIALFTKRRGESTEEAVARVRKTMEGRIREAEAYLAKHGKDESLSEEQYHEFLKILCADEEAYKNMPYLRALNLVNKSGHRINPLSAVEQAERGWRAVTPEDLMVTDQNPEGVMAYLWYHTFAPDLAGGRMHSANDFGLKTQGKEFGRVRSTENPQGMWELEHNELGNMDREEALKEIDILMAKDLMLRLAGDMKPEGFTDASDAEFYDAWEKRSLVERESYQQALRREQNLKRELAAKTTTDKRKKQIEEELEDIRKNHALPSTVSRLKYEMPRRSRGRTDSNAQLIIDSSQPAGVAAFRPKMAEVSYFDRGIPELRKINVQNRINKVEERITARRALMESGKFSFDGDSVIPKEVRGYTHHYDMDRLAFIPFTNVDWATELKMTHLQGHTRLKARLRHELPRFARMHGLEEMLTKGQVPELFMLMMAQEVQTKQARKLARNSSFEVDYERERTMYLMAFWELFRMQNSARTAESRTLEMLPSGGLPTVFPGLFNRDVYLKEVRNLRKENKNRKKKWSNEKIRAMAEEIASRPEHNTWPQLLKRYKESTNNIETITLPFVPVEHMVLHSAEAGGGVDLSELSDQPLAVQANDVFDLMNYMNSHEDVRNSVDELVREGEALSKSLPEGTTHLDIGDAEKRAALLMYELEQEGDVPLRDRLEDITERDAINRVYDRAKEKGAFDDMGDWSLYVYADTGKAILLRDKKGVEQAEGEGGRGGETRKAGALGVRATKQKGSMARYRLTPEGAMMMLNGINNYRFTSRIELATLTNLILGERKPMSELLESRPFAEQRQNANITLNVLEELQTFFYEGDAGDAPGVRRVTHGFQGYRGEQLQMMDAETYLLKNLNNRPAHLVAATLPLRRASYILNKYGETEVAAIIEAELDSMSDTAIALGQILRLQEAISYAESDPRNLPEEVGVTPEQLEVFHPFEDLEATWKSAMDLLQKINKATHEANMSNDMYYRVRRAMETKARVDMTQTAGGGRAVTIVGDREGLYDTLNATSREDRVKVDKALVQMGAWNSKHPVEEIGSQFLWLSDRDPFEFGDSDVFAEAFGDTKGAMAILDMINRLPLQEDRKKVARIIMAQSIIKNPAIVDDLELFAYSYTDDHLPFAERAAGVAYTGGTMFGIRTEDAQGSLADFINTFTHELAHIGCAKFLGTMDQGSVEWQQAKEIMATERGKQMMWELIKAQHGGRMSKTAEHMYNYYLTKPEEFMVEYTAMVMQRDMLYHTGALAKVEAEFRGELGFLDRVVRKVSGWISKLLHDMRIVFDYYRETDPELYHGLEEMADRIMGLNRYGTPMSPVENGIVGLGEPQYLQSTFVNEGSTRVIENTDMSSLEFPVSSLTGTNSDYIALVKERRDKRDELEKTDTNRIKLEQKRRDGTISMTEEATLTAAESHIETLNSEIVALDSRIEKNGYGRDFLSLSREDYELGMDRINNSPAYNPSTGEYNFALIQNTQDKLVFLSYILRSVSERQGDKVTENLAGLLANGFGAMGNPQWLAKVLRGIRNSTIAGTKAQHTFLSPEGFIVLLSTLVEDGAITTTGTYDRAMGVESLSKVRIEMDRFRSLIREDRRKLIETHGDREGGMGPLFGAATRLAQGRSISDLDLTPEEIKDVTAYAKAYTSTMEIIYRRAQETNLVTSDERRAPSRLYAYKLAKGMNIHSDIATEFHSELAGLHKETLSLANMNSRVSNVALMSMPFFVNPFASDADFEADFDRLEEDGFSEAREHYDDMAYALWLQYDRGVTTPIDMAAEKAKPDYATNRANFERFNKRTEFRKKALSQMLWESRAHDSSLAKLYKNMDHSTVQTYVEFYNQNIHGEVSSVTKERMKWMLTDGKKIMDQHLGYRPFSEEYISESLTDISFAINTPAEWHAATMFYKSVSSAFVPYDTDFHPSPEQIEGNEIVSRAFEKDLGVILTGVLSGLGTQASQRKSLNVMTGGANMDLNQIIDLIETAARTTPIRSIDGTLLVKPEGDHLMGTYRGSDLELALRIIKRKARILTGNAVGFTRSGTNVIDFSARRGSEIIRMVYGSNLGTAIGMVEGSIQALGTVIQMGDLTALATGVGQYFKGFVNKQTRIELAEDMAYCMQYTMRDSGTGEEDPFLFEIMTEEEKRASGYWGMMQRGHMATSKFADIQARGAAAIAARRWLIRKLKNGSLDTLAQKITDAEKDGKIVFETDGPADQKAWKGFLRDIKGLGTSNHRIALMLKEAGLLTPDGLNILRDLLDATDGRNGMYRLSDITHHIMSQPRATTVDGEKKLKILNALEHYEKQYINQFFVDPRVLDSATDPNPAQQVVHMYRNFPYSFTIQRVMRDSSNMSIVGFVAKQLAHLFADMAYMTVVQLAAGREPEELIQEWTEDPGWTAGKYLLRYPGLGPWWSVGLQTGLALVQGLVQGKAPFVNPSVSPIYLAAMSSVVNSLASIQFDDSEDLAENIINLTRVIPGVGEAIIRAGLQIGNNALHGDTMGGSFMRSRRGGRGSTRGIGDVAPSPVAPKTFQGFDYKPEHPYAEALAQYEGTDLGWLVNILIEMGGQNGVQNAGIQPMPGIEEARANFGSMGSSKAPQQAPEPAPEPPQAQEAPQPAPTSETAPEPSQAPSGDPIDALSGDAVKDAPPEVFS